MKLFDLSDDILGMVADELYKARHIRMINELIMEWRKRRPSWRLIQSGGRKIHEGRAFLKDLKKVKIIQIPSKYWICGIRLFNRGEYSFPQKPGLTLLSTVPGTFVSKIEGMIIDICSKNGWDDFQEHTNWTIVRYLLDKEKYRII